MKRSILFLSAMVCATIAQAATFTISGGGVTRNYTITTANAQRILAFASDPATYGIIPNPAFNPNCTASCPPPTITNPDPLGSMYDAVMQGIKNNVINYERSKTIQSTPLPPDLDH